MKADANLKFVYISYNPHMLDLDLLTLRDHLRVESRADGNYIWDPIRKKWLLHTREEVVRQLIIAYLTDVLHYPPTLIQVEKGIQLNGMLKRFDILVYDRSISPLLLIECKSPDIDISQDVFDQIARYNMALKVPYLLISNGLHHFCCSVDHVNKSYSFLEAVPTYIS